MRVHTVFALCIGAVARLVRPALVCLALLSSGCGGGSSPAGSSPTTSTLPPAPDYSGFWVGRGSAWTIDNIEFAVQGNQITAFKLKEVVFLDPLVNLGGGQFAVGCDREFSLTAPATITTGLFRVSLSASEVSGVLVVTGSFTGATAASGNVETLSAPRVCGYQSTGTVERGTWSASKK